MLKYCKINIQKSNWFLMPFGGRRYKPTLCGDPSPPFRGCIGSAYREHISTTQIVEPQKKGFN